MFAELRQVWKYRELLLILVQRDLKVRYKNSVLGFGWSVVNPLAQVAVITFVLKFLSAGVPAANYHAYVFCAIIPWIFFYSGIMDASYALTNHQDLIRRTNFPRELIPLSAVLANLIHLGMSSAVFLVYMAGNSLFWWAVQGQLDWAIQPTVLLTPLPVLGLVLLVTGIGLMVSVWSLYYEDVRFLLQNGLVVLYWLVPILYFADLILIRPGLGDQNRLLYTLYMLNPVAAFISLFRKLTLPPPELRLPAAAAGGEPIVYQVPLVGAEDWLFFGAAMLVSLGVAWAGYRYFAAWRWKLAERA